VTYPYKGIALLSGRVKRLVNSLTAHPQYGSFFVMEMLRYEGVQAPAFPLLAPFAEAGVDVEAFLDPAHERHEEAIAKADPLITHEGCKECGLCVGACPMKAIEPHAFWADKCLRAWQGKGELPREIALANANRVLGCHTCQVVCPLNVGVPRVPARVDGQALWEGVKSGAKGLEPFADLLGRNYLRPVKLGVLMLGALAAQRDDRAKEAAKMWLEHPDGRLRSAAKEYLERMGVKPQLEREVKRLLSEDAYLRLAGRGEAVKQVNHYFANDRYSLRIRHRLEEWELTLKLHAGKDKSDGNYEYNAPLTEEQALSFIQQGIDRTSALTLLGQDLLADLDYLGCMTTWRTVFWEEGLRFELDKSEYLGATDYEIECEVDSEEQWDLAVKWTQDNLGQGEQSPGKYRRFLAQRGAQGAK